MENETGGGMWDWSPRRLCNYVHIQLVSECEDETEAEDLIKQLTMEPEEYEEDSRAGLAQQLDLIMPGAIVRG
jgi:hypothetical protein